MSGRLMHNLLCDSHEDSELSRHPGGREAATELLRQRISEAGCSSTSYLRRLRLAYRDFAIVCHARSGSHLLASALDSHFQIHCQAELLQLLGRPDAPYAAVCQAPRGAVNGAIIMYHQWSIARALKLAPSKIIHLLRHPERTALSNLRNEIHRRRHGSIHNPHASRSDFSPQLRDFPVENGRLHQYASRIRRAQQEFTRTLPQPRLEITYEELCGDHDVFAINRDAAMKITDFLKVARVDELVTNVRKTSSALSSQLS
jgi:hypothetical protein